MSTYHGGSSNWKARESARFTAGDWEGRWESCERAIGTFIAASFALRGPRRIDVSTLPDITFKQLKLHRSNFSSGCSERPLFLLGEASTAPADSPRKTHTDRHINTANSTMHTSTRADTDQVLLDSILD